MSSPSGGITAIGYSVDQIQAMEKELSNLKSKLEVRFSVDIFRYSRYIVFILTNQLIDPESYSKKPY